jgi:N-methylhydantoinase A
MTTSSMGRILVGVDVGGTFTDVLAYDPLNGEMHAAKVPSLPDAQWVGVLDALAALGITHQSIREFVHGTTIATNCLLERKGAATALVTTQGFRDLLEIGRARRLTGGLFNTRFQRPDPIVPRPMRLELKERMTSGGEIEQPVELRDCIPIAQSLRTAGVQAVAVVFINSHINDANERAAVENLQSLLSDVEVSCSAGLIRESGEFERVSTAVLNAYLTPMMVKYLKTLGDQLSARGVTVPVNIMGSNGGAMTLSEAAKRVVGTFLSGPVGGVSGAIRLAEMAGLRDVITFDMGGTSTDVALIHDLTARMSHHNYIDSYPLQMPQFDVHTIGAGGGSIIWIDSDGTLQIGPRSAGAVPGPACYGRGGEEATISDANLILGRLPTARPLSGGLILDRARAEQAFTRLGQKLNNKDIVSLADGALRVAVAKMAGAVQEVSVHRGFDPRDFTLLGFGGAGPMHVFQVADELAIRRVMIPLRPGHLCALGQMLADLRRDWVLAWGGRLRDLEPSTVRVRADKMRIEATRVMETNGIPREKHRHSFTLDMRYDGQSFTLPIPWDVTDMTWDRVRMTFDARHADTFGYADRDNDVEIVNVRLVSVGIVDKPEIVFKLNGFGDPELEERDVWFDGWVRCSVLNRDALPPASERSGPIIIEESGGTSVIPPGWLVHTHDSGALLCTRT